MLEFILKADSLVDPVSEPDGMTPLTLATKGNNIDVMKILIQHGAYVACEVLDDLNVFSLAVMRRHVEAAKLLIDSGLDLNATAYSLGLTAIHLADFQGLDELVVIDQPSQLQKPTDYIP